MSNIALTPNASGTGTFTIASPNSNTNRTLTLPDASGTVNVSGLANEVPAGSVGAPAIYSTGDTNTGIFFPEADTIAFSEGGTEVMRINSAGFVGIGTTSPEAPVEISLVDTSVYSSTTDTDYAATLTIGNTSDTTGSYSGIKLLSQNASGSTGVWSIASVSTATNYDNDLVFNTRTAGSTYAERMRIDSLGNVGIGTTSPATPLHVNGTIRYTNRPATGTITAIGFDTNGDLKASSSSLRYKHDIQSYEKGIADVMQLRPVRFKFNGENITNIGFIAEEVDALGMSEVMLYNENAEPEGISYANMVSLLTKAIQEQQALITTLFTRIEALEATQ